MGYAVPSIGAAAGLLGTGNGSVSAKVLSYQTHAEDSTDTTIYTFATQAIGTAAVDRRVIVGVRTSNSRTTSTLTVGGISATLVKRQTQGNTSAEIWIADVPTGTTASIVVTLSGAGVRCSIGVWSCTGLTTDTAVGTAGGDNDGGFSTTLTTVAGGFAIGYAGRSTTAGQNATMTWTGVTERFDTAIEGINIGHSGADATTAAATLAVTATGGGAANTNSPVAFASF